MTDEPKTQADKVLEAVNAEFSKSSGWVKTHIAWIIGLGCLVLGALAGHFIHR